MMWKAMKLKKNHRKMYIKFVFLQNETRSANLGLGVLQSSVKLSRKLCCKNKEANFIG